MCLCGDLSDATNFWIDWRLYQYVVVSGVFASDFSGNDDYASTSVSDRKEVDYEKTRKNERNANFRSKEDSL